MAYMVKFSPGFDWTKGGKLPGLCGGGTLSSTNNMCVTHIAANTQFSVVHVQAQCRLCQFVGTQYIEHHVNCGAEGGKGVACPVGCSAVSRDRGFSTRLMWRSGGRVVTYAYYPDKPSSIRCGEDWKWSKKFQSGKWHHIRMWAKLNTPGKWDGEFKAWLDGEQVLHRQKIPYRYNGSFKISRSYITTYAGGSSVSLFAPNQNQYIWFKDFETWSGGGDSTCRSGGSSPTPSPTPSSNDSVRLKGVGTKWASKGSVAPAVVSCWVTTLQCCNQILLYRHLWLCSGA